MVVFNFSFNPFAKVLNKFSYGLWKFYTRRKMKRPFLLKTALKKEKLYIKVSYQSVKKV